jgi:hypothetical protein
MVRDGATDDGKSTNDIVNALGIRVAKCDEFTLTTPVLVKTGDVFSSVNNLYLETEIVLSFGISNSVS